MLSTVRGTTPFSVWVMFSRMLSFKASMVLSPPPCKLSSSGRPKERNPEMSKSGDRGGHRFCDMIPPCSAAKTCALKMSASQSHLLRLRVTTVAQHRPEQRFSRSIFHLLSIILSSITVKNVPGVLYELFSCVGAVTVIFLSMIIIQT
jgi:hypothetical protein